MQLLANTLPIDPDAATEVDISKAFRDAVHGTQAPADWLRLPVGSETLHLGRLHYEGLINPKKLERGLALLERNDLLAERLVRIARSLAFVASVEPCRDSPDFYDLTVDRHSNYLAGEAGLVAIHNTGSNFSAASCEKPLPQSGDSRNRSQASWYLYSLNSTLPVGWSVLPRSA